MKKPIALIVLTSIIGFMACEAPNEEAQTGPEVVDIEEVFKNKYQTLTEQGPFRKKARINDSTEVRTVELTADQWKKELQFFTNSDINRKSWVDYFTIDSQWISKEKLRITYTTDKEKVPVKRTEVVQNANGETTFLSMHIKRSNPISGLNRKLIYAFPDSIIIENEESLWLVGDQNVKISYTWPDPLK